MPIYHPASSATKSRAVADATASAGVVLISRDADFVGVFLREQECALPDTVRLDDADVTFNRRTEFDKYIDNTPRTVDCIKPMKVHNDYANGWYAEPNNEIAEPTVFGQYNLSPGHRPRQDFEIIISEIDTLDDLDIQLRRFKRVDNGSGQALIGKELHFIPPRSLSHPI